VTCGRTRRAAFAVGATCALLSSAQWSRAEPYLAVNEGMTCQVCHTSPTGGGKRTPFGNVYTRQTLAAHNPGPDNAKFWTGELFKYLAVGGDIRGGWSRTNVAGQPQNSETELQEFLAYAKVKLIPNRLMFYVDSRLGPGDPITRELYLSYTSSDGRLYVRGGDFFLPFGFRLQDDEAFIRQVTGINYNTPDTGLEVGLEQGKWSTQLAITRGTAGGPEVDSGKQYSLRVSHVRSDWRIGGSFNFNDSDAGNRQMQNVFAGLRTGRVAWLAEFDYIIDDGTASGRRKLWSSLVEANFAARRGHNLKLTLEFLDPDIDVSNDRQNRFSVVWEYFPIQFVQTRIGYRKYNGIPQNAAQNREQLFVELHMPF